MRMHFIELTESDFERQYSLLINHLNRHASWGDADKAGCLFESFGPEIDFVREQDPRTIWTLVDGEDGDLYVISGYRYVNRLGYLISTVAVPRDVEIQVHIPMESGQAS